MSVEFVGTISTRRESEFFPPIGPPVQPEFVGALARTYEQSPLGAVRVGQSATSADAVVIAQHVLGATERLAVSVSVSPHLVEPVSAARAVATLAALFPGRVHARVPALHGDFRRHAEFAQLVSALWRSPQPVQHHGTHYAVTQGWSALRPGPDVTLAVDVGEDASSDATVAAVADTCFVPMTSPAEVARRAARLRDLAGLRTIRIGISTRVLVAADDAAARALARRASRISAPGRPDPLIGTVEVLGLQLAEFVGAGVEVFHVSGYDPLPDVSSLGVLAERVQSLISQTQRSDRVHDVA